ncbi:ParA family protein [Fusibacter sp. 3D3]|uniref:AAA family ATPase n=1 Tax=Fusibacter sp. 3D3 TaxID=1048380 RepID=UPI0008536C3A|nr:ParA family protein [Fusibacter sp. 3D3]GAU76346.1 type II/IV secretion system ATPase TadZ/CpaE [Fusibacter sp. 3D3]
MRAPTRLLIVDYDNLILDQLMTLEKSYNGLLNIEPVQEDHIDQDKLSEFNVVIIQIEKIKDLKKFSETIEKHFSGKVLLITDKYVDEKTRLAQTLGYNVHYKFGSSNALAEKLFEDFKENIIQKREALKTVIKEEDTIHLCVYSPQGGSGKSTIAINLAIQYTKANKKVLLVDMAQIGSIGAMLHVPNVHGGFSKLLERLEVEMDQQDLSHVHEECFYKYQQETCEFDILMSSSLIKMEKMRSAEVGRIQSVIRNLGYDVVIYDTSTEICERNLSIFDDCDKVVLVSTPDIISSWKLIQVKEILKTVGVSQKCVLIVNRFSKHLGFTNEELEIEMQMPLVGVIKEEKWIKYNVNEGIPITLQNHNKTNEVFSELAHKLCLINKNPKKKWGFKK